jgi:hypothetical protein
MPSIVDEDRALQRLANARTPFASHSTRFEPLKSVVNVESICTPLFSPDAIIWIVPANPKSTLARLPSVAGEI